MFEDSRTKVNLMRAFAGESQARNRYTFAAGACRKLKLHVLEEVFRFTADQEKEHAELFYGQLVACNGQEIALGDAGYPVGNYQEALVLLRDAQRNEWNEYENIYRSFAQVASEEGFSSIGRLFTNIAAIEKTHSDRFAQYAEWVQGNALFNEPQPVAWLCLNCGHIHTGTGAPNICPVCQHDQGYFIRALHP